MQARGMTLVTYLCCESNAHFLQLAWLDVGGGQFRNDLEMAVLLSIVQALVVLKIDAVGTSLVEKAMG